MVRPAGSLLRLATIPRRAGSRFLPRSRTPGQDRCSILRHRIGVQRLGLRGQGQRQRLLEFRAVLQPAVVPEYLLNNVRLKDGGCNCIEVPPYDGRDQTPLKPGFRERGRRIEVMHSGQCPARLIFSPLYSTIAAPSLGLWLRLLRANRAPRADFCPQWRGLEGHRGEFPRWPTPSRGPQTTCRIFPEKRSP